MFRFSHILRSHASDNFLSFRNAVSRKYFPCFSSHVLLFAGFSICVFFYESFDELVQYLSSINILAADTLTSVEKNVISKRAIKSVARRLHWLEKYSVIIDIDSFALINWKRKFMKWCQIGWLKSSIHLLDTWSISLPFLLA